MCMNMIFGFKNFEFVDKIYIGQSREDLAPTWSVLWIHKDILCCHICMNVFTGGTPRHPVGRRKEHLFYQGKKRRGGRKTTNEEVGRDNCSDWRRARWEVHREQIWNLKLGFSLDVERWQGYSNPLSLSNQDSSTHNRQNRGKETESCLTWRISFQFN